MAIDSTAAPVVVFAQAGDTLNMLLTSLLLAAALLVGALIIAWAARWRKRSVSEGVSASDQLAHFRSLYEQGAISQEEFNRLRGLLGGRLKAELELGPKPPPEERGRAAADPPLDEPPASRPPPRNGAGPA
jgi:uncharacterized membrane protein